MLVLGNDCSLTRSHNPTGLIESFNDINKPSKFWNIYLGAHIGTGCGIISDGNSLYFDGRGVREAQTVSLDTKMTR